MSDMWSRDAGRTLALYVAIKKKAEQILNCFLGRDKASPLKLLY